MEEIFISYSRHDQDFADRLSRVLRERGIAVWVDTQDIQAGDEWRAAIAHAIGECQAFLVVLSPQCIASKNVVKELSIAESRNRHIVPIMYQSCDIPEAMEYQLAGLQWIDFSKISFDAGINQLARILRAGQPVETGAPAPDQPATPAAAPSAVDKIVPLPALDVDKPFLMPIEDIFSISGRGTAVTGRIERGKVKVGEEVEIVGFRETKKTMVAGVEMFKKLLDEGVAGDNVGVLLRGIGKDEVERGMVLAKPGSITPHTKFKAEVYVLTKEEGGRHTPFVKGYRPQFYFRTTEVTGVAELPTGTEMVMPGDNVSLTIELITPVAMEKGLGFAIREGGRTVGAGTISDILQ